jgi:hypothetical protein
MTINEQSGGDFLTNVRNLTVPFGILLASRGMQLLNDKKNSAKPEKATKTTKATKATKAVTAKASKTVKASKDVKPKKITKQKGGELSFKDLSQIIVSDFTKVYNNL